MTVKASGKATKGVSGRSGILMTAAVMMLFLSGNMNTYAAQIYQWKDASGVIHFSDNPNAVPPQYRKDSGRNIQELPATRVSESAASKANAPARYRGREIWRSKCAECHYVSGNALKDGKRGLHRFIIDEQTNFPRDPEQVLPQFKYATSGRTSEMPPVDISDDELRAMIKYLAKSLK